MKHSWKHAMNLLQAPKRNRSLKEGLMEVVSKSKQFESLKQSVMRLRCEIFGFFLLWFSQNERKYISFAQLVLLSFLYFFRKVCLLFNFWIIKFTIMGFFEIIVNSIIQKLKSKRTSLKKYTKRAKLTEQN